jgi:flagellar assembly factor FliW
MPVFETKSFGRIPYEEDAVLEFPSGLPGFDTRHRFVALDFRESEPLIFLQSLEDPCLCFITLPVLVVDPCYRLEVDAGDLARVGLAATRQPRIGEDVLCLAVVAVRETGPTANLLAPIVVNLANRKAVQAVAPESGYSHQQALVSEEAAVCS